MIAKKSAMQMFNNSQENEKDQVDLDLEGDDADDEMGPQSISVMLTNFSNFY